MFYTLQIDYFATNSSQQSFTKNIAKIKTIRDFTNPTPFLVKYRAPIKLPAIPKTAATKVPQLTLNLRAYHQIVQYFVKFTQR